MEMDDAASRFVRRRFALAISKDIRSWVSLKLDGRFGRSGDGQARISPRESRIDGESGQIIVSIASEQTKFAEYVRAGTVTAV